MSENAILEPPVTKTITKPRTDTQKPVPWHVVLHDDSHHTFAYVIIMMSRLFGKNADDAFRIAMTVDSQGRVICDTTHKERAEFKRDQILGYGADPLMQQCKGSMTATIEPAENGDDDDD